jgi:hypothetical protein
MVKQEDIYLFGNKKIQKENLMERLLYTSTTGLRVVGGDK